MNGSPNEDATRAMDALRRVVRALRVSSRAVERAVGVSGAQLFALRQLAAAPGQSLSDLATRTHTHQSTVSEVVARLVDAGLVARRTSSSDARRAELTVTARGRTLLRSAPPTVQAGLLDGLARLPDVQRRSLADALDAWLESAGLAEVPAPMFFEPGGEASAPSGGARRLKARRRGARVGAA